MKKRHEECEILILLILGKTGGRISMLHLHKIYFFLWKFHPKVRRLVDFVAHLKGPYSRDLDYLAKNPTFLTGCWKYITPLNRSKAERVKGGYLEITEKGKEVYKKLVEGLNKKAKRDEDVLALISAVDLIVPLYTRLEWDELLFLLYTDETNKKFSEKSELSKLILKNSERIVDKLVKKGIIPEEKREPLIKRAKSAGDNVRDLVVSDSSFYIAFLSPNKIDGLRMGEGEGEEKDDLMG